MVSLTSLAATLLLFATVSLSSPAPASVKLPAPTGPHKHIGTYAETLTDPARLELFGPKIGKPRRIVAQAYYPIAKKPKGATAKYGSDLTLNVFGTAYGLPNGTLSSVYTNSYLDVGSPCPDTSRGKLIPLIFSTGMGNSRVLYQTYYEQLASQGYFVVAIDHPYDASIVEFPEGGEPAYSAFPTDDLPDKELFKLIETYLDVRVADAAFVAQTLATYGLNKILDLDRLGMFGHSLGGATSVGAIAATANKTVKIRAGINMDGMIVGKYQYINVKRPVLILGTQVHNSSGPDDLTWAVFKKAQNPSLFREIIGQGFRHGTYSDLNTLVELLGIDKLISVEIIQELLGTVKAVRARAAVSAYLEAFFAYSLQGVPTTLLDKDSPRFPEFKIKP